MTNPNKIDLPLNEWLDCLDEGYEARIYTREGADREYPLVGEVRRKATGATWTDSWTLDGLYSRSSHSTTSILPPKKDSDCPDEVYIATNEIGARRLCYDKDRAKEFGDTVQTYVLKGKPVMRAQIKEIVRSAMNCAFEKGRNDETVFNFGEYADEIIRLIEGRSDG